MKWEKKGLIFVPNKDTPNMISHAAVPCIDQVDDVTLKVIFCARDKNGYSIPYSINLDATNPSSIKEINCDPLLSLGELGTFDEAGIMPCWITNHNDLKYLYYVGWTRRLTIPYHNAIGLAISEDNGKTFKKVSKGAIISSSINDPFFTASCSVLIEGDTWRMWYLSCTDWKIIGGIPEPFYCIKYAESKNGINWVTSNTVCIGYDEFTHAISRPCVFKEEVYKMFYSYRNSDNYRVDKEKSYRIGYAESKDGLIWQRKDEEVGIDISLSGWDSEMIEYGILYVINNVKYLFYNGNGFGKTGLGYAILINH